jgi:hypothetical protein
MDVIARNAGEGQGLASRRRLMLASHSADSSHDSHAINPSLAQQGLAGMFCKDQ